jgi:hypothetical protein
MSDFPDSITLATSLKVDPAGCDSPSSHQEQELNQFIPRDIAPTFKRQTLGLVHPEMRRSEFFRTFISFFNSVVVIDPDSSFSSPPSFATHGSI